MEQGVNTTTSQEATGFNPHYKQNAEAFLAAIKSNEIPFLGTPDKNGIIEIKPVGITSAATGKTFKGINQLLAQMYLKDSKCKEIITFKQANEAGAAILKDAKSFVLTSFNAEEKKTENYHYFTKDKVKHNERLPNFKPHYKAENETFISNSSNIDEYLGKYLAATSLGAKFQTKPEIQEELKNKLINELNKSHEENKFTKIFEIGKDASAKCKEVLNQRYNEQVQNRNQNFQRTQSNSISR